MRSGPKTSAGGIAMAAVLAAGTAMAGDRGWAHGGGIAERMIARIDSDGDGAVSRAEVDAFIDGRFEASDADGDGEVTEAEMIAKAQARAAVQAAKRFARLDTNGDGRLSRREVESRAGVRFDCVFERVDGNGDGIVTPVELRGNRHAGRDCWR